MKSFANRYPGKCFCGKWVEIGEGFTHKEAGKPTSLKWQTRCADHRGQVQPLIGDLFIEERAREPTPSIRTIKAQTAVTAPATYRLMSGHEASAYQAAVFEHFQTGMTSAIINAVAGAGKTTTIKNALRYLAPNLSVQLFAFNVEAAKQLKAAIVELEGLGERAYGNVKAGTFHSTGFSALRRHLERKPTVNDRKIRSLVREALAPQSGERGKKLYEAYADFVCDLVGFARGEGIGCLVPDTMERWFALVEHHGIYPDSKDADEEQGIEIARGILDSSNELAKNEGIIDYDDMLYLPLLWRSRLRQTDVVIVDEAQDTNPVRRAFLRLSLKRGGRLYAVGDPRQSIFGFCGATPDAMDLIAKEFATRELPLTVSYRCGRLIVERAQTWVPYIEAAPLAAIGEVCDDVLLTEALGTLTSKDAVLCRNTAPLVALAYSLIGSGRACRIIGRDIGVGLVSLIEKQHAKNFDALLARLERWRDRQVARFIAKGQDQQAEAVEDRVACITTIVEALPEDERKIPALIERIEMIFADSNEGMLTLSTVHRAKGKEWPQVAILRPDLMPARWARQAWQQEQETNLMYVAATRAQSRLIYTKGEAKEGKPA